MVLCPYCGSLSTHQKQCSNCHGYFDLLSRQRSQNAMGPWFIRDVSKPFQPGCSYSTLVKMIQRGKIKPETVIRGPATRQFWTFARNAPGIAHLLGECHSCHSPVMPIAKLCPMCRASFVVNDDRQHLGLSPIHLLPGDADAATIAASLSNKVAAPAVQTSPPPEAAVPAPEHTPAHAVTAGVTQAASEHAEANQAATQSQVVVEQVAHPVPTFPEPEVKVILAEDEKSGSSRGLVFSIVIAFIVVAGAGFWAWSYLSARATPDSMSAAETFQADLSTGSDVVTGDLDALEPEVLLPTDDQISDNATDTDVDGIPAVFDSDLEESPNQPQQDTESATEKQENARRLAYDRALIGIAEGNLDEEAFQALLDEVAPQQRGALEELWVRRQDQVRLGRDGG
ncbi:MAG: hypothetical protein ED559_06050 [Phycisphaera sp.]|nr:MAG: hypothetical protein ED559_06050 [Phycisphaera sp.]